MYAKTLDEMHRLVSDKIGLIDGVLSSESFIEMKTRTKPMPYMTLK
jgi:Lrp/AsnC family transcriptional regulator for asnA, asnC and gidA